MNKQTSNDEKRVQDDLTWLAQRMTDVTQKEESYFCNIIREALTRGWMLMDARNYAFGKLMANHF